MKIRGFVGNREVSVDLPVERIAELGIDPWRLDLMDPNPVVVEIFGKSLSFSQLADVAFAYVKQGTVYMGVHDGSKAVCFFGDSSKCGDFVEVSGFGVSQRRFEEHLAEYLEISVSEIGSEVSQNAGTRHDSGVPWADFGVRRQVRSGGGLFQQHGLITYRDEPLFDGTPKEWYPAVPSSQLEVCGDRLRLDDSEVLRDFNYRGTMNQVQVLNGVELPEHLNWVHRTLAPWKPTLFSTSLLVALLGQTSDTVEVFVQAEQVDSVRAFLRSHPGVVELATIESFSPEFSFQFGGYTYNIWEDSENEPEFRFTGVYMIESIRSVAVNQVMGPRIAFADLGDRLLRSNPEYYSCAHFPDLDLDLEGFSRIEDVELNADTARFLTDSKQFSGERLFSREAVLD